MVRQVRCWKSVTDYRYVRITGRYLCLRQNPFSLARAVLFKADSTPDFINLKTVASLVIYQLRLRQSSSALKLPIPGTWCLPLRSGYKVFDIQRKTVTKLFSPEVDDALVEQEIKRVTEVADFEFTPSVFRWSVAERRYEEEYVFGTSGANIAPGDPVLFMDSYYENIEPCLEKMILAKQPQQKDLSGSVELLVEKTAQVLSGLQDNWPDEVSAIREFVDSITRKLVNHQQASLFKVFSHGDFHLYNVFATPNGVRVIDWEGIEQQFLLSDFYNYFFSQLWVGDIRSDLTAEVDEALASLQVRLQISAPELANNMRGLAPVYRWLFYLERIDALITVFHSDPPKTLVWVDIYRKFENLCAEKQVLLSA